MKKSYRPGVYSQYDIISKPKSYEQRYAFFCGGSKVKEEKNIPANTVVQLRSVEELKEYFLEEGSGKVFAVLQGCCWRVESADYMWCRLRRTVLYQQQKIMRLPFKSCVR